MNFLGNMASASMPPTPSSKDTFPGIPLRQVANIKFLAVLKPNETERLSVIFKKVQETGDTLQVSVMLSNETQQFSKIKLVYGYERV